MNLTKKTISINIHAETIEILKDLASANDRSISYMAERLMIDGYLKLKEENKIICLKQENQK